MLDLYQQIVNEYKQKLRQQLNNLRAKVTDPIILKQKTEEVVFELTKEATNKVTNQYSHKIGELETKLDRIKLEIRAESEKYDQKKLDEIRSKIQNQ